MKRNLIVSMLDMEKRLRSLPPSNDWRCFYSANELAPALGVHPNQHTAQVMRHLGWIRTVRKVYGITQRVWFPPAPVLQLDNF